MKASTGALLPTLVGVADTRAPLHRQVYARVRGAILDGAFAPGHRLPSTRTLAADLGLSRITVESAFTQLRAEGFVVRRVGSGSYVADVIPEHARPPRRLERSARAASPTTKSRVRATLSDRGRTILHSALAPEPIGVRVFQPCMPALDAFPQATWARLLARRARRHGTALLAYGEAAGHRPLREAIAAYLASSRGVRCTWEQVVVLSGAQQGIELAARLLLDPGDEAWLEEPGYLGARGALRTAGATVVPVPVDDEGIDVAEGIRLAPRARLAYVTPSHQYPLGVTMSLSRRLALLAWAERADAWIVEDDYDAEFRYSGRPIAAVQGLAASDRVLYVGTFNKVMFPSLRLAYLVAPPDLVDAVVAARALVDGHPPVHVQAALTDFVCEGHFGAHVRRMRALYEERRDALTGSLVAQLDGVLRVGPSDAGMHVAARLMRPVDDEGVVAAAAAAGLGVGALSRQYLRRNAVDGLLLGFTGSPPDQLRRGVRTLAGLLRARSTHPPIFRC
jgi:GntR family transcriptional regulator/MocR family aminotransferase